MSKARSQRRHARLRAFQRYRVRYDKNTRLEMIKKIQTNQAVFIERQSCRITIWHIPYGDKILKAVYDKKRGEIVTFLPIPQESSIEVLS